MQLVLNDLEVVVVVAAPTDGANLHDTLQVAHQVIPGRMPVKINQALKEKASGPGMVEVDAAMKQFGGWIPSASPHEGFPHRAVGGSG